MKTINLSSNIQTLVTNLKLELIMTILIYFPFNANCDPTRKRDECDILML